MVRHGSAKAAFVGSIPTLASNFKLRNRSELQNPEEAVPVKVPVKSKLVKTQRVLGKYW